MSRTKKGAAMFKDWWSKRPYSGKAVSKHGMKVWKRFTHKVERKANKSEATKSIHGDLI